MIDLFVKSSDWTADKPVRLTDFSSTQNWLLDAGIAVTGREMEHYAQIYGVEFGDGALQVVIDDNVALKSIMALGQACVAIAGAQISQRQITASISDFMPSAASEIGVASRFLGTEPQIAFEGLPEIYPSGNNVDAREVIRENLFSTSLYVRQRPEIYIADRQPITVDFLVSAKGRRGAIMVARQSPRRKIAERWADHAFATFYDLKSNGWEGLFVSAFDDVREPQTMKIDDRPITRLSEISTVVRVSSIAEDLPLLIGG